MVVKEGAEELWGRLISLIIFCTIIRAGYTRLSFLSLICRKYAHAISPTWACALGNYGPVFSLDCSLYTRIETSCQTVEQLKHASLVCVRLWCCHESWRHPQIFPRAKECEEGMKLTKCRLIWWHVVCRHAPVISVRVMSCIIVNRSCAQLLSDLSRRSLFQEVLVFMALRSYAESQKFPLITYILCSLWGHFWVNFV